MHWFLRLQIKNKFNTPKSLLIAELIKYNRDLELYSYIKDKKDRSKSIKPVKFLISANKYVLKTKYNYTHKDTLVPSH